MYEETTFFGAMTGGLFLLFWPYMLVMLWVFDVVGI